MSRDLRIVVIGHSLRPEGGQVVDQGLRLARSLGARAEVLHAMTPMREHQRGVAGEELNTEQLHARLLAELSSDVESRPAARDLSTQCHVATGPPELVLDSVAGSLDADIIVVGPAEPGAIARGALGSATRKLLRTAQYPVLVVRGELALPPSRVVAAIDFSRPSMWGLRLAEELVNALRPVSEDGTVGETADLKAPVEVEVFTVLDENEHQQPLDDSALERFVADQLKHFADESPGGPNITNEIEVRRGDPTSLVLSEIERRNPDLVVVGGSGKGGADRRQKLGSVARQLALEAPCSVLFVPPRAAEALEATTSPEWQAIDPDYSDEDESDPDRI